VTYYNIKKDKCQENNELTWHFFKNYYNKYIRKKGEIMRILLELLKLTELEPIVPILEYLWEWYKVWKNTKKK